MSLQFIVGQFEDFIFTINNYGETGFYFSWKFKDKYLSDVMKLTFKDADGYVKVNSEAGSIIRLLPIRNFTGRTITIKLQVISLEGSNFLSCRKYFFVEVKLFLISRYSMDHYTRSNWIVSC